MSTGEGAIEFETWLAAEYADDGSFTALIILVSIAEATVTPLCSTYVNVIGAEVAWGDLVVMFAGAGREWDGAAFFPRQDSHGRPLDNPAARLHLRELESRVDEDRLVLNEGHFFDRFGRRMRVDEVTRQ